MAQLAGLRPDVIVVAAFGQVLPQSVLDIPAYGCVNIHPSLLPKFRGASPVAAAILAGSVFTGVSIMLLDRGMDTGPVFTRVQIPVAPGRNVAVIIEAAVRNHVLFLNGYSAADDFIKRQQDLINGEE